MSKRAESKYKINRRLGVNLWGRAKSPLNKREYGPGQHGQRRKIRSNQNRNCCSDACSNRTPGRPVNRTPVQRAPASPVKRTPVH